MTTLRIAAPGAAHRILAVRRTGTGAAAVPGTPADRYPGPEGPWLP